MLFEGIGLKLTRLKQNLPVIFRVTSAVCGALFSVFLFLAITYPDNARFMTLFQTFFSATVVSLAVLMMVAGGRKLRSGLDAMNSLIPLSAGGLTAGLGLLGVMSHVLNVSVSGSAQQVLGLAAGVMFLTLGIEIIALTAMAWKAAARPAMLVVFFLGSFGIDALLLWLAFPFVPFWNGFTFLAIGKVAMLLMLMVLGLRVSFDNVEPVRDTAQFAMNSFFTGIVFFIMVASVVVPAYYIFLQSGHGEVSTIINIQNPIVTEFLQQAGVSTTSSADFLLAFARALSPVDFQTLQINLGAIETFAVGIWTSGLGLEATTSQGVPVPPKQIVAAVVITFMVFLIGLAIVRDTGITFANLEKSGQAGWLRRIIRRGWVGKKKKQIEGE
jgi:hypothetical protein